MLSPEQISMLRELAQTEDLPEARRLCEAFLRAFRCWRRTQTHTYMFHCPWTAGKCDTERVLSL